MVCIRVRTVRQRHWCPVLRKRHLRCLALVIVMCLLKISPQIRILNDLNGFLLLM